MAIRGPAVGDFQRRVELQQRTQERELMLARLVLVALLAGVVFAFRDRVPAFPVVVAVLGVVAAYSVIVPWLLIRYPSREVGIVSIALDMTAVTVAVYVLADALDAYLAYGLVIVGAALRFGLGASVWAAVVVSALYVTVVIAGTGEAAEVRQVLPVRVAYLLGFGLVAGLFSRVVIGRTSENARLQQRLVEEERERARAREQELLSRMARDFGASLDHAETVSAVVSGAAPHLGDATLLYLVDDSAERLEAHEARGGDASLAERLLAFARERRPRVGEGIAGGAAATVTTTFASSADADAGASAEADGLAALGLGWVQAAPIVAAGRVMGVLVTVGKASRASPDDEIRRMAEAIAERAGPALQNASLWADLRQQMAREQEAQRIKDDFLSIVSHELRTPLTSIQGYGQLLEARLRADARPAEAKEMAHVRVIRSQAGRMRRLVDDLLDVSRIDRSEGVSIEPADLDLAELVREAMARTTREHPNREFVIEAPESLPVRADRDRIDQVVSNLLENAVKYSPEGGPIQVRVERSGPDASVSVADAGVGIPPEQLDLVFERFYQADEGIGRRRFGGLGLGLYISRAIVEAHGGRIWAEPNRAAGRGTLIAWRIPRLGPVATGSPMPQSGDPPPFVLRGRNGSG